MAILRGVSPDGEIGRILFDGGELSEPLMQRQLFLEWLTDFHHNEYVLGGSVLSCNGDGIFAASQFFFAQTHVYICFLSESRAETKQIGCCPKF